MNTSSISANAKPVILIVDDTPASLFVLSAVLNEFGFEPRPVTSGEAALRAASAEPPDLVLLDINMPNMNGFEVCRRLKTDPRLAHIPVIFISAYGEMEDKVEAFTAGGVDYVTKPFHAEEVRARISVHLELRRKELELERSYEQLRRIEETRDCLVHMLVHDLRAPLNGIQGFLNLIVDKAGRSLPPDLREMLDEIRFSSARMVRMVSDILDVSKAEAGQLRVAMAPCDLAVLTHEVLRHLSPLAQDKTVIVEADPQLGPVPCDSDLVFRTLVNLLTNAFRYTKTKGEVRVELGAIPGGVRIRVVDHGPGIPKQYQDKIFEKFGTVAVQGTGTRSSVGLGLAFCKMVALAHGGTIGVESEEGKGCAFWIELPADGAAPTNLVEVLNEP